MKTITKTLFTVALLAASTFLFSCTDQVEDTYETMIIGKWECVHSYARLWELDEGYVEFIDESEHGKFGDIDTYSKDGIVTFKSGNSLTYNIVGDELWIAGGLIKYKIESMTHTELVLFRQWDVTGYYDENGDVVTSTFRFTYSKIE